MAASIGIQVFKNRPEAGRRLGEALKDRVGGDSVVLALPRGGVPVALEVARRLGLPLDILIVRKIGVPRQPELAMGAIGEGTVRIIDARTVAAAGVTAEEFAEVESVERTELDRRVLLYRRDISAVSLAGKTAVIVDDGIATGSTMRAAAQVAKAAGASRVIVAVPVAPLGAGERMEADVDELVVIASPTRFGGVGQFYVDFTQTTDAEVVKLLLESRSGKT